MKECYFKSNTPPWVFFTFLKFYKRYQIVQNITYAKFAFEKITKFLWHVLLRCFSGFFVLY